MIPEWFDGGLGDGQREYSEADSPVGTPAANGPNPRPTDIRPRKGHSDVIDEVGPSSFYDNFGGGASCRPQKQTRTDRVPEWFRGESESGSAHLSDLAGEGVQTSVDEAQFWDAATYPAASVAEPQQPPLALLALGLTHLAEEVSVLVELFSKTEPGENELRENDYRQMVEKAFDSILGIRRDYRIADAQRRYAVEILETGS